jgi:hypothetical protein
MGNTNKILLAVEDSEASMKAAAYVAEIVRGREGIHICLFHALPPIPPRLLEYGGTEDPQKEHVLHTELKSAQTEWIEKAKDAVQPGITACLKAKSARIFLTRSISWISSRKSSMPPNSPTVEPSWWAGIDSPSSRIFFITTREKDLWSRPRNWLCG